MTVTQSATSNLSDFKSNGNILAVRGQYFGKALVMPVEH